MAWRFLTNHGLVLIALARHPDSRARDVAKLVGITERAVQRIVAELEAEGYLSHERCGNRKRYMVDRNAPMRHPLNQNYRLGELLASLGCAERSLIEPIRTDVAPEQASS